MRGARAPPLHASPVRRPRPRTVALDVDQRSLGEQARQVRQHRLGKTAPVRRVDEHDVESLVRRRGKF